MAVELSRREKWIARGLSGAIHAAAVAALWFSITNIQRNEPPMVVELWGGLLASAVPAASKDVAEPAKPKAEPKKSEPPKPVAKPKPAPKAVPKPPQPKAAPRPEKKAVAKPQPAAKPVPKTPAPDIALSEAREKERKKERERKEEAERTTRAAAEAKERADARTKQAEAKRLESERAAQEAARDAEMRDRIAKEHAARAANVDFGRYVRQIQERVRRHIVEPGNLGDANLHAVFDVVLLPGGEVLRVQRKRSSGVPAYDDAAERAIMRSSPLPISSDPAHFQRFRELELHIKRRE